MDKFEDDFLENNNFNINENNFDFDDNLKLKNGTKCKYAYDQFEKCQKYSNESENLNRHNIIYLNKEFCDNSKSILLNCLKLTGKFVEK